MGIASRLKRERREAILAKLQTPEGKQEIHTKVVQELSKGSLDKQIGNLSQLSKDVKGFHSKFQEAIYQNAPKEMDKAIIKFIRIGKPVTVESLTAEVRSNKQFLALCAKNNINITYFENLAKERIEVMK